MRVLLVSPYHGGSHAAWGEGLRRHSRHRIQLATLPARFWKWRMHGGAITLARSIGRQADPEAIVATDMLDLAGFLALTRRRLGSVPAMLYMHENQLTYPLPADGSAGPMRRQAGERDRHYGFINLTSMLAADRVLFNSEFHRSAVLAELPRFLRHFPEHRELAVVDRIARHSAVLPVGVEVAQLADPGPAPTGPPLVLWNQRWEYDKNPAALFEALARVADSGVEFRLALCGQRFGREPADFGDGIRELGDRVVHHGYLDREDYCTLLRRADVVVSTSDHEFFGVGVVEAIVAGAFPILPRRLSYPELLPRRLHELCLYRSPEGLVSRLQRVLGSVERFQGAVGELAGETAGRFGWSAVAPLYDDEFRRLIGDGLSSGV